MMMQYKGYTAVIEYDDEARIFHGEVVDINDVVTFQGTTVDELEREFQNSIDDYLEFCADRGESPEKPFSGKFVLRVKPAIHRKAHIAAKREKKSLNRWVEEKIEQAI